LAEIACRADRSALGGVIGEYFSAVWRSNLSDRVHRRGVGRRFGARRVSSNLDSGRHPVGWLRVRMGDSAGFTKVGVCRVVVGGERRFRGAAAIQ